MDPSPSAPPASVERFLEVTADFQLGALETEQARPETAKLSFFAREDPSLAVDVLKSVDQGALARLQEYVPPLEELARAIAETLAEGKRIFLCGCGATGRLSISLETFAREGLLGEGLAGKVIGFMVGGDAALVRSIERFEDYPDYGARQLRESGFADGDLMVGITEGGETPFVIGATEEAARHSSNKPFFLYCNPDQVLAGALGSVREPGWRRGWNQFGRNNQALRAVQQKRTAALFPIRCVLVTDEWARPSPSADALPIKKCSRRHSPGFSNTP